ncbi:MAG: HNH endonuclease [Anaerolineae bacterium]|nr:HNH endonuclease [Anaerolineae bacterium]
MSRAFWLEMSRDEIHGGGGWSFTKCLWSPAYKTNGQSWAFWNTLLEVKEGDQVLHLRGIGNAAAFIGYSTAELDGYVTDESPPDPGIWEYAKQYYRVPLRDFILFPQPLYLVDVFANNDFHLREYFNQNRSKLSQTKLRLFYVIQADRLQCLNGAYLSEVDVELAEIIFGNDFSDRSTAEITVKEVTTSEAIRGLRTRIGQQEFSEEVRHNYGNKCCFPDCEIAEDRFLVGAHIARWVDAPELRGKVSNGLCLCLMHDKAFEAGYFTISEEYEIVINSELVGMSRWARDKLLPFEGKKIRLGKVLPSKDALLHHWIRTKFY